MKLHKRKSKKKKVEWYIENTAEAKKNSQNWKSYDTRMDESCQVISNWCIHHRILERRYRITILIIRIDGEDNFIYFRTRPEKSVVIEGEFDELCATVKKNNLMKFFCAFVRDFRTFFHCRQHFVIKRDVLWLGGNKYFNFLKL
jgi:hypothetical protein